MVAYTRDEIVSTTELSRNLSGTLKRITSREKEKIAISKNNKLEAVLISIEEYERLKEAYDSLHGASAPSPTAQASTEPLDGYFDDDDDLDDLILTSNRQ